MNQTGDIEHPAGSNPVYVKATWTTAVAAVLALLLLGHSFGAESQVPAGQSEQLWSKVKYDPKLTDPFFESNEWSYPWWIIKHPDGHFESTRSEDKSPVRKPPRLKHTAKCFSNLFMEKHLIKICEAKLLRANMIDLYILEENAAFVEGLKVQIRNGMFTCEHSGLSSGTPLKDLKSTTKRRQELTRCKQGLTLDEKVYRKGDVIKGRVHYECVRERTDPQQIEKHGRVSKTTKVYGVFKTVVK